MRRTLKKEAAADWEEWEGSGSVAVDSDSAAEGGSAGSVAGLVAGSVGSEAMVEAIPQQDGGVADSEMAAAGAAAAAETAAAAGMVVAVLGKGDWEVADSRGNTAGRMETSSLCSNSSPSETTHTCTCYTSRTDPMALVRNQWGAM